MLTKEEIRKILEESPLIVLFSQKEIESIVDDIFQRYDSKNLNNFYQKAYQEIGESYEILSDTNR